MNKGVGMPKHDAVPNCHWCDGQDMWVCGEGDCSTVGAAKDGRTLGTISVDVILGEDKNGKLQLRLRPKK